MAARTSLHLDVESAHAVFSPDVASGRRTRLVWLLQGAALGLAVLMVIALAEPHASAAPSHHASASFNPAMIPGLGPGIHPASTGIRPDQAENARAEVVDAASFSLSGTVAPRAAIATPTRAAQSAIRAAYNPQPSKARPKKSKQPKEKVKQVKGSAGQLVAEQTFFEGPPSITETFIPGASLLTVVGVIPFTASLARQAWTRYKITNKRIEVASGFQGKEIVQILYREIVDLKWLRRYGGAAGDIVITLQDGSKVEMRSLSEFDRNFAFIMSQVAPEVVDFAGYPDKAARDYQGKVESGEEPKPELPALDAAAAPSA